MEPTAAPVTPGDVVAARLPDAALLATLLSPREVWRNFGYHAAPSAFRIRLMMRAGTLHAWFIRAGEGLPHAGCILLFGLPGPAASLEFAIALAEGRHRGAHLASRAARAVEAEVFQRGMCREMWAWMDAGNAAVLRLARACGWDVEQRAGTRTMADGCVETCLGVRTRAAWCRDAVCRGGTVPCPYPAAERPCRAA